ncbi:MAG: hypothetical protein F4X99_09710 [Gammaproteobacteria bacterium]|nr:hypothetical protein [Gammaproteobacteria bacterium]
MDVPPTRRKAPLRTALVFRARQVDARFAQVEARLDRLEARMERMQRRVDDQLREMAAGIARQEGLIQGLHGPHAAGTSPRPTERPTEVARPDFSGSCPGSSS